MKKETSNPGTGTVHKKSLKQQIYYYRSFYIMFIPVFIFAVVFHYLPMLGIRYSLFSYKGIKAPEFIGLANFERMFSMPGLWKYDPVKCGKASAEYIYGSADLYSA